MKNRLLIIDVNPFGGLTDSMKWVEYLKEEWDITMICFAQKDGSRARVDGFKLIQLRNSRIRQIKALWFLFYTIIYVAFFQGKILVEYFPTCDIYKRLYPWKKMLLDIRTLSVSHNESIRDVNDAKLRRSCRCFDRVTAISEGVARKIGLPNIAILPLGSDVISFVDKIFTNSIRLLYVGTFTNRHIELTIEGVIAFHKKHPDIPIQYKVIGFGIDDEESLFRKIIKENKAEGYITIVGKVAHNKLSAYFDECNVGFSFVPITNYYSSFGFRIRD